MKRRKDLSGILLAGILAAGGSFWVGCSDSSSSDAGHAETPMEFGALESLPPSDLSSESANADSQESGKANRESTESPLARRAHDLSPRPGDQYRVYGRPAMRFDPSLLQRLGKSESEIDALHEKFKAMLGELPDLFPDGVVKSPIRQTKEERAKIRQLRKRHLTDAEFDAALFATSQLNRAFFAGPIKPHVPAAKVGMKAGDQLVEINGIRVFDAFDYSDGRELLDEGEYHHLVIARSGKLFDVEIRCCRTGWGPVNMRLARPISD